MSKFTDQPSSYVNEHEMNDWLVRNNYRQTMQNRQVLQNLANRLKAEHPHHSTQELRLEALDQHHEKHGIPELEKDH